MQRKVAASPLCNRAPFIAILLLVAAAMFAVGMLATPSQAQERSTATVSRVVDGDTIEISPAIDGKVEVRLIGVDTPETVDPNTGVQPYGPQASQFTTQELEGERVELEFDEEREDQFGRLLAYVYLPDGTLFNETLLRQGYAQLFIVPTVGPAYRAGSVVSTVSALSCKSEQSVALYFCQCSPINKDVLQLSCVAAFGTLPSP